MRKIIVSLKSILVLLTLCLICSNSYARHTMLSSCVYEMVTDTLPDNEKKRMQENEQQREIREAEQVTAKEMEWYSREKNWLTMPQKKKETISKSKKERSSDEQKSVVFGIRGGVNFASLGIKNHYELHMVTSFHAGINLDIRFIDHLHLNTGLLFSQKGYMHMDNFWLDGNIKETVKAQFIMLPVQLSLRLGFLQINAGPYVEYGIGGEIEYGRHGRKHDTFDYYKALNYGITAGVGVIIGKHFFLGANYEMGMSDYANRNIAISLGVDF